ncbi:phosphotransferase [Kutzneria kofuensis]|uniref:phosphotransferase n=1 Tax=Kutzneria kofuensis TaxID=103725 RepID=UPI0031E67C4A
MHSPHPSRNCPQILRPALATAEAVLAGACHRAGVDHTGARLVQLVGNAVFQLARAPIFVKIILNAGLRYRAENSVAAARLLADHGVPAVRLAPVACAQPVHLYGCTVTFWKRVPQAGPPAGSGELAKLLTQLHTIPTDPSLRRWDPIADLRARIAAAADINVEQQRWLRSRCERLAEDLTGMRYRLPRAVIHGDARPANLINTRTGPVVCDLDTVCVGPAEWDLVPMAVGALRFRGHHAAYRELVDLYGYDVTTWGGFATLRRVRELKLVAVAVPMAAGNPRIHSQLRHRLRTLREGADAAWWTPYR